MIDAHAHIWSLDRGDYEWLTPDLGCLYRDHSLAELGQEMQSAMVFSCVLVQAARTIAETEWLLVLADEHPCVAGVVGWTDLANVTPVARPHLVGVRAMPEDLGGRPFDDAVFDAGFAAIATADLTFDAMCEPDGLAGLARRIERTPGLRVILDHGGLPDGTQLWMDGLGMLAAAGAWVKLSGLATLPGLADGRAIDIAADYILRIFPGRVLWGSDWPVVTQSCEYRTWAARANSIVSKTAVADPARVFGGAARDVYRMEHAR